MTTLVQSLLWVVMYVMVDYSVNGMTCLKCSGVVEPRYCVQTTPCQPTEECYTEKVIGEDGNVFYNSGCREGQICQMAARRPRTYRFGQLHVCEECCGFDRCNTNLCNQNVSTPTRECYKCDDISNPRDCQVKTTCGQDEECFAQELITQTLQTRYNLGCETKRRCGLLAQFGRKRITSQLCNECCSGPGCNRHLCITGLTASSPSPLIPNLPNPCVDHASVDCAQLSQFGLQPCKTINNVSTRYCPHFCGFC